MRRRLLESDQREVVQFPSDRRASERLGDHLRHILDVDDLDSLLDRRGNLRETTTVSMGRMRKEESTHVVLDIRSTTSRRDNLLDSSSVGGEDLLFQSTDGQYLTSERHLSSHG